jgi:hypothetical protein
MRRDHRRRIHRRQDGAGRDVDGTPPGRSSCMIHRCGPTRPRWLVDRMNYSIRNA